MSDNAIASRIRLLNTESAFQILARANELEAQGRHIIHCEIGQPDFKTPPHIIEAAYKAMKDGYTGYTPTSGYADVRAAIAGHVRSYKNVPAREDEIVIVPGGKPVMFFAAQLLVDPGDEVIYPNPGFPIYESVIRYAGGIPVPMPLLAENDFRPDWNAFERSISEKTKLLILNSPSNPTGAVYSPEEFDAVMQRFDELLFIRGHVAAVAPVNEADMPDAVQALCRPRAVHRGIAAADDDDLLQIPGKGRRIVFRFFQKRKRVNGFAVRKTRVAVRPGARRDDDIREPVCKQRLRIGDLFSGDAFRAV